MVLRLIGAYDVALIELAAGDARGRSHREPLAEPLDRREAGGRDAGRAGLGHRVARRGQRVRADLAIGLDSVLRLPAGDRLRIELAIAASATIEDSHA